MEPALFEGEMLWGIRVHPRRGSIVIFPHPRRPAFWLTKRVVAVAGDTVEIDFGSVLVNGQSDPWGSGETFPEGRWELAAGSVFVLSDNRTATIDDGRTFGPVDLSQMYRAIRRSRSHH